MFDLFLSPTDPIQGRQIFLLFVFLSPQTDIAFLHFFFHSWKAHKASEVLSRVSNANYCELLQTYNSNCLKNRWEKEKISVCVYSNEGSCHAVQRFGSFVFLNLLGNDAGEKHQALDTQILLVSGISILLVLFCLLTFKHYRISPYIVLLLKVYTRRQTRKLSLKLKLDTKIRKWFLWVENWNLSATNKMTLLYLDGGGRNLKTCANWNCLCG